MTEKSYMKNLKSFASRLSQTQLLSFVIKVLSNSLTADLGFDLAGPSGRGPKGIIRSVLTTDVPLFSPENRTSACDITDRLRIILNPIHGPLWFCLSSSLPGMSQVSDYPLGLPWTRSGPLISEELWYLAPAVGELSYYLYSFFLHLLFTVFCYFSWKKGTCYDFFICDICKSLSFPDFIISPLSFIFSISLSATQHEVLHHIGSHRRFPSPLSLLQARSEVKLCPSPLSPKCSYLLSFFILTTLSPALFLTGFWGSYPDTRPMKVSM